MLLSGPSTLSNEEKERFPRPAESQAIIPVHIVKVQLQLHCLPDKLFHTAGYNCEDLDVLEFHDMVMTEPKFCQCQCVWMSKPNVPVVLFYSGFYRSTSMSDVHLTTHTEYAVNPRSPQYQVIIHRTKESGDLPGRQANKFNVIFGQYSAESVVCHLDIRKKSE